MAGAHREVLSESRQTLSRREQRLGVMPCRSVSGFESFGSFRCSTRSRHPIGPERSGRLLLLLELLEDRVEISSRASASTGQVVVFELLRQLEIHERLLGRLAGFQRLARMRDEEAIELAVVDKVLPWEYGAVAGNHAFDAFDPRGSFRDGVAVRDAAAAVVHIENRLPFLSEHVAGVHQAQVPKDDERVAVGVSRAEVVRDRLIRSR